MEHPRHSPACNDRNRARSRLQKKKAPGRMPGAFPATVNVRVYFFTLKKAVIVEPSLAVTTARKHKSAPLTFGVFQF
jgi:hypothetical protein